MIVIEMKKLKTLSVLLLFMICSCNKMNVDDCCSQFGYQHQIGSSFIATPNVFTPNGDGINDYVYLFTSDDVTELNFKVYDNNTLVFETTDIHNMWDGKINANDADEKDYSFVFNASSPTATLNLTGEICLMRTKCSNDTRNCAFATQFNGEHFDASPSGETHVYCND